MVWFHFHQLRLNPLWFHQMNMGVKSVKFYIITSNSPTKNQKHIIITRVILKSIKKHMASLHFTDLMFILMAWQPCTFNSWIFCVTLIKSLTSIKINFWYLLNLFCKQYNQDIFLLLNKLIGYQKKDIAFLSQVLDYFGVEHTLSTLLSIRSLYKIPLWKWKRENYILLISRFIYN